MRYGNSKTVVALLNEMLIGHGGGSASLDSASSQISPGAGLSLSSSGSSSGSFSGGGNPVASLSALPTAGAGAPVPVTGGPGSSLSARPAPSQSQAQSQNLGLDSLPGNPSAAGGKAGGGFLQNVRITADVTNNAILVYANAESQRIVEQTIRQIDRPQRQIAIEATIAEITLNDQLNYGVQFFLASQKGSISNTIPGVTTSPAGGGTSTGGTTTTAIEPASNAVNAAAGALLGRVLPGFNLPDRRGEFAARHPRCAA